MCVVVVVVVRKKVVEGGVCSFHAVRNYPVSFLGIFEKKIHLRSVHDFSEHVVAPPVVSLLRAQCNHSWHVTIGMCLGCLPGGGGGQLPQNMISIKFLIIKKNC